MSSPDKGSVYSHDCGNQVSSADPEDTETDDELLQRHTHVKELHAKARQQRDRMKRGRRTDEKSRWIGSLYFTLLQIESKMRERGLVAE